MDPVLIVLGVLALIAAAIAAGFSFSEGSVVMLGAGVMLALLGVFGLHHGWHGINAREHGKHVSILTDLRKQGFKLSYGDVYAIGGHSIYGSEIDLSVGKCIVPLIVTKLGGTWYATFPNKRKGFVKITPVDLSSVC